MTGPRVGGSSERTCGLLRMTNSAGERRIDGVHRSALPHPSPPLIDIELDSYPFARIREDLSATAWERLERACEDARVLLEGRTLWSINSTARGGGIAEMQRTLWPYWRAAGLEARWLVLSGSPAFFGLTKRLHNLLHGCAVARPGVRDHELFARAGRAAAAQAAALISPGDIVILQDPQTAGLVAPLKRAGAAVIWRCHVGADQLSEPVEAAWRFLLPYIEEADAFVFTRRSFVPPDLDGRRVALLTPAIDPRSPKNRPLEPSRARAILDRAGLARHPGRLVVALARWDSLKDPVGIIDAFATHVQDPRASLVVAGPAIEAVADDPEGGRVLAGARAAWRRPAARRARIQLAALPMADLDANALIVNALQREADVVVKKSLQEGFGLGVTEGMWKRKPVVATRVGGHRDQIADGQTGLLVDDPTDLPAFAAAIDRLLSDPALALELGAAGREQVRARYLADRHFINWVEVLSRLQVGRSSVASSSASDHSGGSPAWGRRAQRLSA
jgi:trehalose synthase